MLTVIQQFAELQQTVEASRSLVAPMEKILPVFVECLISGKKVLACGNGGSAADAMHLVEELVGRYRSNRKALPAISLNSDPTILTCIANDWSYNEIFKRQVEAHGQPGDFLVCFSTSGNSPSILLAVEAARKAGLRTLAVLGKGGGKAKAKAEFELIVPHDNTARIQEIHTWILHVLLEAVEAKLGI